MKVIKGFLADRSATLQWSMLFVGLLIGAALLAFILYLLSNQSEEVAIQLVSSIMLFLFPAAITAWTCSKQPKHFLFLHGWPSARLLLWVILATLLIQPVISLIGHLNMQMQLPAFMEPVESWMKAMENAAKASLAKRFADKSILSFLTNLMTIGVVAGITEEFFFRGALFSLFRKALRNHHVLIWTVAFIFSATHLQFYGFVPILLMGAYLGYLLYWTNTIWVPVFAHFLNNAMVVIIRSNGSWKEAAPFAEEIAPGDLGWFSVVTGISLILFFWSMRQIAKAGISSTQEGRL